MVDSRVLALLRRRIPILPITIGVVLGEVAAWFSLHEMPVHLGADQTGISSAGGWLSIVSFLACAAVLYLARYLGINPSFWGALLGATATFMACPRSIAPPVSASDAILLVRITESPRRQVVGGISFVGQPLLPEVRDQEVGDFDSAVMVGNFIDSFRKWPLTRFEAVDLPWRNSAGLQRGDIVWVRGAIQPAEQPLDPLSREARTWRSGITALCKVAHISLPLARNTTLLEGIRNSILERTRSLTGDRQATSIFLSMALGYQDLLGKRVEDSFRHLGLTHLLVVSGYQVTLVFGVVFWVCVQCARTIPGVVLPRTVSAWPAILSTSAFVILCGADNSTVRALLGTVCIVGHLIDEHSTRFSQRIVSSFLVLSLLNPGCFFDLGVQLTFAALTGILCGSKMVVTRHNGRSIAIRARSAVCVGGTVWVFTCIVGVLWTGKLSLVSMPLNLIIAAPWSALNCLAGVPGLLLSTIGLDPYGYIVTAVVEINELLLGGVEWLAQCDATTIEFETIAARLVVGALLLLPAIAILWAQLQKDEQVWRYLRSRRRRRSSRNISKVIMTPEHSY